MVGNTQTGDNSVEKQLNESSAFIGEEQGAAPLVRFDKSHRHQILSFFLCGNAI